ncbi:UNVERIFIED_CONTAM: perosamine synthetase [Brevibacillus sp. OAP136]
MAQPSKRGIPAIEGGKPIRASILPYGRQWLDDDDKHAVRRVLEGDFLTTGPAVAAFEEKVAAYTDAKYAVAFANGTAALHGACFAAGITGGDEVITTPMTFAASANAVLYTGGKPVFCDIEPDTLLIDPTQIERHITVRTKGVIPVDYTGQPARLDEIREIAQQYGLIVIEDAAQAFGADVAGKKIGSLSDMTMFSFHPVKSVTTGEGGIITTNDDSYYQKLLQFRSHGITRDPARWKNGGGGASWYYEMHELGFNYRMTDIQAALGASQLAKVDGFISRRAEIAAAYTEAFRHLKAVSCPVVRKDVRSSWHLYVIRLREGLLAVDRQRIFTALEAENIGVNVHYIPVYLHPYYQSLGYERGICPQAEKSYEQIITLPLFPAMSGQDVQDVIDAVEKVIHYYRAKGFYG